MCIGISIVASAGLPKLQKIFKKYKKQVQYEQKAAPIASAGKMAEALVAVLGHYIATSPLTKPIGHSSKMCERIMKFSTIP